MTQVSRTFEERTVATTGMYLLALATIAAGVFDFIWGEFEPAHQPIGALGDHIPGQSLLAYITALGMICAGAAILSRRTRRAGAIASAFIYLSFGLFWLPRLYTAPHALGFRPAVFIGVLAGMFTQLIVVAGSLILYASVDQANALNLPKLVLVGRWTVGLGALLFGLTHLTGVKFVAMMIPAWVPLGGPFWVVVSGIAFVLAALAILTALLDVLAAHLLALMLFVFEFPVLIPNLLSAPHNHIPWGSNAYNLAAVGALCIFAASLRTARNTSATTPN